MDRVVDRLSGSAKLLRAMNTAAVLSHLLNRGPLTRADIRDLTGLSKPTTSEVLRKLVEAGFAIPIGHTSGGPGPNAEIYAINPEAGFAAAISVRETSGDPSVAIAICDLAGEIRAQSDVVTNLATAPAEALAAGLRDLCAGAGLPLDQVRHVQLGVPGSYDPTTDTIHLVDVPGLERPGLVSALRAALGAPVAIDNDVNLAAVAERGRGVAAGVPTFALLWLDHGLGLAIDLGGPLLRGARGSAGEIGYMPVGLPTRGRGNVTDPAPDLDSILAGAAVLELAAAHRDPADTAGRTGSVMSAGKTLELAVSSGNDRFIEALAERIAVAATAVAAVLDPSLIVLGGAVAQAGGGRLRDAVVAAIHAAAPIDAEIATTGLAEDAVLLGAIDASLESVREVLIQAAHDINS
jgi:predicted NBD/HSP70 family sugar kinase